MSVRKSSVSVDELEDVAASPASSVLSTEQAPVPSKPVTVSSRNGRGMQWMLFASLLSVSCQTVVCVRSWGQIPAWVVVCIAKATAVYGLSYGLHTLTAVHRSTSTACGMAKRK